MSNPETLNRFMVSVSGRGELVIMLPPMLPLSKEEALGLAAWLVALSGASREEFEAVLAAVEAS